MDKIVKMNSHVKQVFKYNRVVVKTIGRSYWQRLINTVSPHAITRDVTIGIKTAVILPI